MYHFSNVINERVDKVNVWDLKKMYLTRFSIILKFNEDEKN